MKKKGSDLKAMSNKELLVLYETAAKQHGRGTDEGDYRRANEAHDVITAVRHELIERSCDEMLTTFLTSPDGWVRHWAATHLLQAQPSKAAPALERLASGEQGYLRLVSEMALKEWRAGRLRLP